MTLESFLEHVNQRKPLNTPEIFQFLNEMNDEARRITAELNNAYHNMDEIRELFPDFQESRLILHSVFFLLFTRTLERTSM